MTAPICVRKRPYANKREADSALFRMRARGQDCDGLHPYRCAWCERWHLGRKLTPPRPITGRTRMPYVETE